MPSALITGASSGIGRALALRMAREGYALTLLGRDRARLATVPHARIIVADLAGDLTGLDIGKPETIVHCAGVAVSGRVQDIPPEAHERVWRVNFAAPALITRRWLREASEGQIVFVTSGVAGRALPYVAPYCAAKAALNAFSESLRIELADTKIRVLLFSPGSVATGFHSAMRHFGPAPLAFPPARERTAEWVAERLWRAIRDGEQRVTLGARAKIGRGLNAIAPSLTDRIVSALYRLANQP